MVSLRSYDGGDESVDLRKELRNRDGEIERPCVQRDAGVAHDVARRLMVACRVHEVARGQGEGGAVGEHLVEVVVGRPVGGDPLVLGVEYGRGPIVDLPDDVGLHPDTTVGVEVDWK